VAVVRFRARLVARRAGVAARFFFAVLFAAFGFAAFALVRFGLRLLMSSPPSRSSPLRLSYARI
jgi:hypothetical protein